jgi:uncharacterized membrane protein
MFSSISNLSVSNNMGTSNSRHAGWFFRAELLSSLKVSVLGKMIGFIFSFLPLQTAKLHAQQKVIVEQNKTSQDKNQAGINIQIVTEKEISKEQTKENDWKNDWKIVGLLVFLVVVCIAVVVVFVVFRHDKQKGFDLIMKMLDVVIAFFTRK